MVWLETAAFGILTAAAALVWWHRDRCSWERAGAPRGRAVLGAHAVALSLLVQRNVSWFSTGLSNVVEWIVLIAAALAAASVLRQSSVKQWLPADRWYGYFLVSLLPGAAMATEPGASATVLVRSAIGLLAVAALHNTAPQPANVRIVADWARLVALLAVVGNVVFAVGRDADLPYGSALIIPRLHPNDVGFIGVVLVALTLLPARADTSQALSGWWLPVGWLLVGFNHYRVGLFGLVIVIAGAWPRLTNRVRSVLVVGWCATFALSELVFTRLRVVTRDADAGVQIASFRRPIWEAALEQLRRAPLFGRGINSVAEHQIRPTLSTDIPWGQLRQVHNTWLDVAVSGGVVAFVVWCGFVVCVVIASWRRWRQGIVLPALVVACAGLDSLVDPVDRLGWVWLVTMTTAVGTSAVRSGVVEEAYDAPQR